MKTKMYRTESAYLNALSKSNEFTNEEKERISANYSRSVDKGIRNGIFSSQGLNLNFFKAI